jgi:hypothetical protein
MDSANDAKILWNSLPAVEKAFRIFEDLKTLLSKVEAYGWPSIAFKSSTTAA